MSEFKNLNKSEFDNFLGNITLYSLNELKSLGDNVNISYRKMFTNNSLTYLSSLSQESKDDLIIIDGDDFNPSKIFGLTKKYLVPIVIFVSNNVKIDKLKDLLLREVLIINKNTLQPINIKENVEKNIKIKEEKDLEKLKKVEENTKIESIENNNKEVKIETIKEVVKKDEESLTSFIDVINVDNSNIKVDKEGTITSLDGTNVVDLRKNKDFPTEEIIFKKEDTKENKKESLSDIFDEDLLKSKIKGTEYEKPLPKNSFYGRITNKNIKVSSLGIFGLNIDLTNRLKEFFDNVQTLKTTDGNIFDVYVLDISFATERVFKFIESVLPMPMILTSVIPEKFERIKYFDFSNILVIPKPLTYTQEEFEDKLVEYLNNYNPNEEKKKIENYKSKNLQNQTSDGNDEFFIRRKYDSMAREPRKPGVAPTPQEIKETKDVINSMNTRFDKGLSLSKLYEDLGLNKLAIYDSQINKKIYSTFDGKVIEYKPNGYLVEIRLKKLKGQGLSEKEINNSMQRFEESDISFERKQLQRLEKYKLQKQKKEQEMKENKAVNA